MPVQRVQKPGRPEQHPHLVFQILAGVRAADPDLVENFPLTVQCQHFVEGRILFGCRRYGRVQRVERRPSGKTLRYELIQKGFSVAAADSTLTADLRSVEFSKYDPSALVSSPTVGNTRMGAPIDAWAGLR